MPSINNYKKYNFTGNEIITGGNIIIPKLIKIEETITSITKMVKILKTNFKCSSKFTNNK